MIVRRRSEPSMNQRTPYRRPFPQRVMPAVLRRLAKVGIVLEPFLIVREDPNDGGVSTEAMEFDYRLIGPAQIASLVESSWARVSCQRAWRDLRWVDECIDLLASSSHLVPQQEGVAKSQTQATLPSTRHGNANFRHRTEAVVVEGTNVGILC